MKIGSGEWSEVIIDGGRVFDLDLDSSHTDLFTLHARELLKWTKTTNLTTITDPFEVAVKHFVDSLAPAAMIAPGATLLDIGSGGGFPGLPLKVVIPSLSVTLIDASRKKVNFLKHVIRSLKLKEIEVLHIRAEELAADSSYHNRFDVILSRALTDLASFTRHGLPLLSAEGVMIALKGKLDPAELEDLESFAGEAPNASNLDRRLAQLKVEEYKLPFIQSNRTMVAIRKFC